MTIVIRAVASTIQGVSPRTVTKPTGTLEGDLLLLHVGLTDNVAPTVPSGFVLITGAEITGTANIRIYSKVATGAEPADYAVSWTGGDTGTIAMMAVYSDTAATLAVDAVATQTNVVSQVDQDWAAVVTTAASLLCCFGAWTGNRTALPHAGMTERWDVGGSNNRVYLMTEAVAAAGSTGTRTAAASAATVSKNVTMALVEDAGIDPPDAPSGLTATPISGSRVDLAWTDNSSDEDNFEIEQSANGTTGWALVASPAANATTASITGLPANTTRYWRIRAVNAGGNSAYSSIASALTLNPGRAPITPRMYLLQPAVVFAARVNQPTAAEYPVSSVVYDGVTTGAFADILPGMTLLLGSAAGLDDYGRQRVREVNGAGATSIVVWVGRSSRGLADGELTIVDNAYVTVWDDRRVFAKIPYIDSDGEIFKDGSREVGTNTTTPPPVAVMGAGFAGTIDPTVITVLFNGQPSYAVADGATIASYLWDIADGTLSAGILTDDNITVTFPAGFRHVSLTVTDSNAKTHTTWRPVYARDPADDTSFDAFQIESHRITEQGQTMTVRILADMPRATYPDGTLAMVWGFEPAGAANRDHMLMIGWLDVENAGMNAGRTGLTRDTTLTILDVAGRLDILPGFPQSLADDSTRDTALLPDITWSYMVAPNLDKYLHYLLHWHSTALEVADFILSGDGASYPFLLLASDGDSLWNQVDRRARAFLPDYVLTCDRAGRMAIVPDPILRDTADRTATVQAAIDESEWSDIRFTYQRSPRVHWLRAGAILAGSTEPIGTVFSIAPGDTPGQGVGELTQGEQLALNQTALNAATGHRYARANARVGLVTITLLQDDGAAGAIVPWSEIEPARKEWVTITVSAATAAQRGLTWTTARGLPKELSIRYVQTRTGLARELTLTLELETIGAPGQTVIKPTFVPPVGEQPLVTVPPDMGLIGGQELVAGIGESGIYRTADFQTISGSGGPTWEFVDLTVTGAILSWVVDPFSPGYLTGVGSIDGWVATESAIYRVEDIFGTTTCAAEVTFAETAEWRTIQASFGAYFAAGVNPWLVCVSYYGDTVGHTGTWATYSVDGGATWAAEVLVSALYDSGGAVNPIGLYTSPKTPGLAYTAARSDTESAANPLPRWGIFNDETDTFTLGALSSTVTTTVSVTSTPLGGTEVGDEYLILAPPANANRIEVSGTWSASIVRSDSVGSGNPEITLISGPSGVTRTDDPTDDFTYLDPVIEGSTSGTWKATYTFAGGDWPVNRDSIVSSPPTTSTVGVRIRHFANAISSTEDTTVTTTVSTYLTVTEIELDGGHIYTPATDESAGRVSTDWGATWGLDGGAILPEHGMAGQIHNPWLAAESLLFYGAVDRSGTPVYTLKQANGTTITEIGPAGYGINSGHFAARAYDGDQLFMVLGGVSNTQSGVWVSDDAGATWTQIVAPSAVTAYQAAFGDSSSILFIWGPSGYMGYSANFGVAIDSRAGNLAALSATKLIGIAGGPTP